MGKNIPRTQFLSNKKQKAKKLGIDVSGITITNKLNDSELQALDKRLNDLIKSVKPNYTPKANPVYTPPATPKKPKRVKRVDSASNLLKEYKRIKEDYINSIPKELMEHKAIKNYFTKGEYLVNDMRMYDLVTKGVELHDFNTVKEFKNYFGTTSQKKLERMLKNEIKQLELNMYDKILEEQRKTVKDLINDLDSGNTELSAVFRKRIEEKIDNMNFIQLLEISNKLDNVNNIFDSIYQKEENFTDEPLERSLEVIVKIADRVDLRDYGNQEGLNVQFIVKRYI